MADIDLETMKKVGLFRNLTVNQLEKIQALCQRVEFAENDRIFKGGEKADSLYFVLKGEVDIRYDLPDHPTSQNQTIVTIPEGKSFGWTAMVDPYMYRRSAYCASGAGAVGRMDADALRELFDKEPEIGYKIMTGVARVIAKRHNILQEEVENRGGWA